MKLVQSLKKVPWLHTYWKAGLLLFLINAVIFFAVILLFYLLLLYPIPFAHIMLIICASIGSLFVWALFCEAGMYPKRNRLIVGAVGSSFYVGVALYFGYRYLTLEPAYPGEDTFMRALGLLFVTFSAIIAFLSCFFIAGFGKETDT
ncbi:hypothetical protein [Bacillus sp. 1P06AnD]|uniref:hypothetical protein n=1 Tax=Bacillus sp. 1P06AnD TaxID=3132208 RepID=UPI0039A20FB5